MGCGAEDASGNWDKRGCPKYRDHLCDSFLIIPNVTLSNSGVLGLVYGNYVRENKKRTTYERKH